MDWIMPERFTIISWIGQGSYGSVWYVRICCFCGLQRIYKGPLPSHRRVFRHSKTCNPVVKQQVFMSLRRGDTLDLNTFHAPSSYHGVVIMGRKLNV